MESLPVEPKKLPDNIAVWAEFKEICVKYGGVGLGEGAPDCLPPQFLMDNLVEVMKTPAMH